MLRLRPGALLEYYLGSLPFVLGLLYFIGDMSRSAYSADYCAEASLGLALLFVWMKTWQACFVNSLYQRLINHEKPLGWRGRLNSAGTQTIIQASGLIVLPVAAFLCLPLPWCYAFYQNALVLDAGEDARIRPLLRKAAEQSGLWPKQNHLLLLIFTLMGMVILLNWLIMFFALPYLLKMLFGMETMFSLSGRHLFNTTLWATAFALTYLALDPVIKTVYVLRCFKGISLKTGEDLKTGLSGFKAVSTLLALGLALGLLAGSAVEASAQAPGERLAAAPRISPESLDSSINEVLQRRQFVWRMPRVKPENVETHEGLLFSMLRTVGRGLKKASDFIRDIIDKIDSWLQQQFPKPSPRDDSPASFKWSEAVNTILYGLAVALTLALVIFIIKALRRDKGEVASATALFHGQAPDVADEAIGAEALPTDQWLALAQDLMRQGSYVLALRALFMSALALLAEHQLITLARYKSNREYGRELKRRAHDRSLLLELFSAQVAQFERVWYGQRQVAPQDIAGFQETHQRFLNCLTERSAPHSG